MGNAVWVGIAVGRNIIGDAVTICIGPGRKAAFRTITLAVAVAIIVQIVRRAVAIGVHGGIE